MKQLLIIGIDPGTTASYACLDIYGKVIAINSSKELELNSIVSSLSSLGNPFIIGTDKAKIPGLIREISAKFNAKTYSPGEDVRESEKMSIASGYEFRNSHERDALASALLALRHFKNLFERIKSFLKEQKKPELLEQMLDLVVRKGLSRQAALTILEAKPEKKIIIEKALEAPENRNVSLILETLTAERAEKQKLHLRMSELGRHLANAKKEISCLQKQLLHSGAKERKAEIMKRKDRRINQLTLLLQKEKAQSTRMKIQADQLHAALASSQGKIIAKKLQTLGWDEFLRQRQFISEGDVVWVVNPSSVSEKTVEQLKFLASIIIYSIPIPKSIHAKLGLPAIPAKYLKINDLGKLALINRQEFEKATARLGIIEKVVEAYRQGRSK